MFRSICSALFLFIHAVGCVQEGDGDGEVECGDMGQVSYVAVGVVRGVG